MNDELEEKILGFIKENMHCTKEELYSSLKVDYPKLTGADMTHLLGQMVKEGLIRWMNVKGVDYYRLPLEKPVPLPNNENLNY